MKINKLHKQVNILSGAEKYLPQINIHSLIETYRKVIASFHKSQKAMGFSSPSPHASSQSSLSPLVPFSPPIVTGDASSLYGGKIDWLLAHLCAVMLKRNPTERTSADEALKHPFFWDPLTVLQFLSAASDRLEIEQRNSPIVKEFEGDSFPAFGPPTIHSEQALRLNRFKFVDY